MSPASSQQALTTAERLLNADDVLTAVPTAASASLARGLAGTALLHARLSLTDPAFEAAAVRHWAAAAHATRHGDSSAGTYHSPGGLAASLIIGAGYLPDPVSQRAVTTRASRWLSARAIDLARRHRERLHAGGTGTPWAVYDTITGLAGTGRVLLAALASGHETSEPGLMAALDTLTAMILARHGNRPGWWLPASAHPAAVTVHPSGTATTGMAHGIAGPLALLSISQTAGWAVAGQRTAIQDAAQWLLHWGTNLSWPPYVTGDELDSATTSRTSGRRDAWCYGAPGIGRALSLAGHALGNPRLTEAGNAAIAALADRAASRWDVDGPTLCHGRAGVLQCAAASHAATADRAAAAVTAAFNPQQAFAFQHLDEKGCAFDEPGFLTGAAGVALVLADHGELPAPAVPARWDSLLLLS
ncbi:MAG TPA: lanthionine synthetase C family protein [Streptosporangiaceae bacterium]|nr:lanthionine synthetase C family protein [Streptosporangiaceae bacterium]